MMRRMMRRRIQITMALCLAVTSVASTITLPGSIAQAGLPMAALSTVAVPQPAKRRTPGRTHTVVVQNTLVGEVNDAAIHVLARMLHAPLLARPEYGAHTPIVILLGSDVPTAR